MVEQDDKGTLRLFAKVRDRCSLLERDVARVELRYTEADAALRRNFVDLRATIGSGGQESDGRAGIVRRLQCILVDYKLFEEADIGPHRCRVWYAVQAAAFEIQKDLVVIARYSAQLEHELRELRGY